MCRFNMSSQGHHKMQGSGCGNRGLLSPNKIKANTAESEFTDEIDLGDRFSSDMAHLCINERYADVEFVVEEQRLPAHRVILAARSEYFRALLYGGMSETSQREIKLHVPLDAFKVLLRYIYSGTVSLATLDEDAVIDVLGMANQYGFQDLEAAISKYLRRYLALSNVCVILDAARLYNLDELTQVCLMFMDRNAVELLEHESFTTLSKESLEEILRRDSFFAPEVLIFLAVCEWSRVNPAVDIKTVVSYVRLPLMSLEHLMQVVRPSGFLDSDKILDAIDEHNTSKSLPYRAALWPEENMATSKHSSRCIQGECRSALLDGDVTSYDIEHGYTRHWMVNDNDTGIVVELGTMCVINHIRILLWDRDSRAYSYFIEVSGNQTHWERVIDYSEYHCRSWQYLYFPQRSVRYIRLVGTQNTVNRVFHVVGLEAMHTANVPTLVDGFVAPKANVAAIEMSAIVTDGVSRSRNALINGDYENYDWDSGYTCHQLGSGEIVVRLGQPYYIGSMRLLLWDLDDRTYSFYIETSTNRKDWQMVVDKRNEKARSWQNFHFSPRPVVFIRVVGTRNTANEIFHCVHLECPSQDKIYLKRILEEEERDGAAITAVTETIKQSKSSDDVASTSAAAAVAAAVSAAKKANSSTAAAGAPGPTFPTHDDVTLANWMLSKRRLRVAREDGAECGTSEHTSPQSVQSSQSSPQQSLSASPTQSQSPQSPLVDLATDVEQPAASSNQN